MSDMPKELQPSQTPALGATHAENAGFPYLGSGSEAGAAALERLRQAGMVDESNPAEKGGGGERPETEIKFMRRWSKGCIGMGPDWINQQIQAGERKIIGGLTRDEPQAIALQNEGGLTITLGEYMDRLRLARAVYQSPEEAARSLRVRENLALLEIDEFHKLDGGIGLGGKQFVARRGLPPMSNAEYSVHLESIQKNIEESPELKQFRRNLAELKKEYGEDYLKRMRQRVRRHEIVGLMPDANDLPLFVPLEDAMKELTKYGPDEVLDEELVSQYKLEQDMMKRAELAKQMGLGMGQEAIGGEYYVKMYQKAWDEFCEALNTFPPDVQDEIVANFLVGGSMLGGQFAAFYRKGVEQRGRYPSKWSAWLDAADLFQKVSQVEGYIPPEQIFQALGSVKPEVLAFPDFHTSKHELWLAGENKPREFSISSRDMIGQLGKIDTLARLGANNAYEGGTGFFAVRNGEFAEYLFRQMGFSPEESRKIAYEKAEAPTLIRDNRLSPVRRGEITDIWDWVGETALDKLIVPMAWLKWSRADVEFTPLDVKRRQILSERGLELAHYRVGYSMGLPPDQFLNMIALFPSALSIDHMEMLQWVEDEWCKVKKWEDIEIGSENFNRLTEPEKNQVVRAHIWDKTRTLGRPSLASVRHLARMAMGVGDYNKRGEDFRKVIHEGMEQMPKAYFDALRHPDLWKWRWFENADADPSQWRYIGNFLGDEFSEARVSTAFEGYDFTKELQACGLSDAEIARMPRTGYEGWKRLLEHASLGLLEWSALNYTTGDKTWRYQKKKEAAQDATVEFLKTSSPIVPDFLDDAEDVDGETGQLADLKGAPATFRQELEKVEKVNKFPGIAQGLEEALKDALEKLIPPISNSLGFILNSAQQAYLEAVINMFLDGHGAHRLDALVEDISLEKPKDVERFAGGVNWSVPVIKRKDFMPDSASGRADRRSSLPALFSEGFYFIHMPDSKFDSSDDILISPLATPLPKLIRAGELLDKIERNLESAEGLEGDHAQHVRDAIKLMRDRKAFCWDTLINGRSDIPPVSLIKALNHIREEGPLTAAAKRSIMHEVLRFYKIHPKGSTRFVDKAGKKFDPYVPELID